MDSIFPAPIRSLAPVDLGLEGANALLSQSDDHQILFMQFSKDVELGEHTHEAQWGVVLEGKIELTIDGEFKTFCRGDYYFIPEGVTHSAKIYAGYADVTYFNSPDRYEAAR